MLSTYSNYSAQKAPAQARFIGYVLASKSYDRALYESTELETRCSNAKGALAITEWDVGNANNPIRLGLWRVLRRLVCDRCEPKRMSFSIINFDDFLDQALAPCYCKSPQGLDGVVVNTISHLTSDHQKGAKLVLELTKRGKHVIADDGICLSCCHPAARTLAARSLPCCSTNQANQSA